MFRYRNVRNGAVLARCSQPRLGLWAVRSCEDELLVAAITNACAADTPPPGGKTKRPSTSAAGPSTNGVSENGADKRGGDAKNAKVKTLLIMDARSALAAWANRGKGGGCESASEFKTNSLQIKVPSHHVSCWRISMS